MGAGGSIPTTVEAAMAAGHTEEEIMTFVKDAVDNKFFDMLDIDSGGSLSASELLTGAFVIGMVAQADGSDAASVFMKVVSLLFKEEGKETVSKADWTAFGPKAEEFPDEFGIDEAKLDAAMLSVAREITTITSDKAESALFRGIAKMCIASDKITQELLVGYCFGTDVEAALAAFETVRLTATPLSELHVDFKTGTAKGAVFMGMDTTVSFTLADNMVDADDNSGPWIGFLVKDTEELTPSGNSFYRANASRKGGFTWEGNHVPGSGTYDFCAVAKGSSVSDDGNVKVSVEVLEVYHG